MPASRSNTCSALLALGILIAAGSCSNSGDATANLTPALAVLEVFPADGTVGVDPRSVVRVRFGEIVFGGAQTIVVADAAGPLSGWFEPSPDGRTWRWQPSSDLPRAGRVEIRLLAGMTGAKGSTLAADRVFSFQVRDHVAAVEHVVGPASEGTLRACAWRSGWRAVVNGRTLAEVDASGVVTAGLPVVGQPVAAAAFGTVGFAALAVVDSAGLVLEAARGTLNGPLVTTVVDAASCAHQRSEFVANLAGDLGAYWYGVVPGVVGFDGLWWSRYGATTWQQVALPAAGTFPLRRLAIDGFGRLFVAWLNGLDGRLVLLRHDPATGTSESFDVAELPDSFEVGAAGNGEALVVWRETRSEGGATVRLLHSRRYVPGVGLQAAVELHRGTSWAQDAFAMVDSGAAVAVLRETASAAPYERLLVLRIEANGQAGIPALAHDGLPVNGHALAMAPRGEAWLAFVAPDANDRDTITVVRSRPGAGLDTLGTQHTAPNALLRIGQVAVAVDDGGRAVIAFQEDRLLAPAVTRAIVID